VHAVREGFRAEGDAHGLVPRGAPPVSAKKSARKTVPQSPRAKAAGVKPSVAPVTPADDTAEKIARVLARIEDGELVTDACVAESMSKLTLYAWRDATDANKVRYARAREAQADKIAEDAMVIADDASGDTRYGPRDALIPDSEYQSRSRLRFDARRWYLSKIAPRTYGDKLDVTSGGKPLSRDQMANMTAAQLREEIAKRIGAK
jgi:hypothetical protein